MASVQNLNLFFWLCPIIHISSLWQIHNNMQIGVLIPQCNESTDTRQQLLFTSFIYCNIIFYAIFVVEMPLICFKWQYLQLTDSTTYFVLLNSSMLLCVKYK